MQQNKYNSYQKYKKVSIQKQKYTIQQLQMRTQEYIDSHTNKQWDNNRNYQYENKGFNDGQQQQRYGSIKKNKNDYNHHISIKKREDEEVNGYGHHYDIDQQMKQMPAPRNKQIQVQYANKYEQFQLINRPNTNIQHNINPKPKQITTSNKLKITIQKLNSQQPHQSIQKQPQIDTIHHLASENSQYSPSPQKKQTANINPQIRNSINNMQTNYKATNYNNNDRNSKKKQNNNKEEVQINRYFNNQSDVQQSDSVQGEQIELKQLKLMQKNSNPSKPSHKMPEMVVKKQISSKIDQKHRQLIINQSSNFNHQQELVSKQFKKSQNFRITQYDSNKKANHHNQYTNISKYNKFSIKSIDNGANRPQGLTFPSQFIDSRESNHTRYGPGGIQTLQFNPQQQKFIILDSKQTQILNPGYINIIGSFCQDFDIPVLDQTPTPDKSPQELVNIAKAAFKKYSKYNINEQTVINVRKYKNCVHFSFDNQNNILYHYQNGKIYYGCWRMLNNGQGQKHGQGVQLLPNKYKFKGVFSEGKKSGYGILINFDGTAYVGQWDNGMRHGAGKQLDAQGLIYEGQWKQGKKSGYGKIYNKGRLEFQGVFIKGLKNGYGKQYFQNGDCYDGNYLNHKFQGKGTYSWISGANYTGQFKGGKRNGQGVWRSSDQADCDIYEGQYVQDKKHGRGIYKWANGALYQGSFKNDIKHGEGTIVYQNGKVAHLTFNNGKAQKRIQKQQNEQEVLPHQLSQRKRSLNSFQSKNKNNNFVLKNRPSTRSTQNLNSARSTSTTNSHGPKGVTFNTRSNPKLSRAGVNQKTLVKTSEQEIIRLKFDNKQFEKAIGKNWNKNLILTTSNEPEKSLTNRPPYPKDRTYQGIQYSSNVNMEL